MKMVSFKPIFFGFPAHYILRWTERKVQDLRHAINRQVSDQGFIVLLIDGREYAPSLFTQVLEKKMVETVVIPRDLTESNEDRVVHCSLSNGAQSKKR